MIDLKRWRVILTLDEFKTLAVVYKNKLNVSTEEAYNNGIMCSWSTNIEFKTTIKYSSEVLVKDMAVEDYYEQRRINNYIEKQIKSINKLQKIKDDFE